MSPQGLAQTSLINPQDHCHQELKLRGLSCRKTQQTQKPEPREATRKAKAPLQEQESVHCPRHRLQGQTRPGSDPRFATSIRVGSEKGMLEQPREGVEPRDNGHFRSVPVCHRGHGPPSHFQGDRLPSPHQAAGPAWPGLLVVVGGSPGSKTVWDCTTVYVRESSAERKPRGKGRAWAAPTVWVWGGRSASGLPVAVRHPQKEAWLKRYEGKGKSSRKCGHEEQQKQETKLPMWVTLLQCLEGCHGEKGRVAGRYVSAESRDAFPAIRADTSSPPSGWSSSLEDRHAGLRNPEGLSRGMSAYQRPRAVWATLEALSPVS